MLGDSLSDAVANLRRDISTHYLDEWERLPFEIRRDVLGALSRMDHAREAVDEFQIRVESF